MVKLADEQVKGITEGNCLIYKHQCCFDYLSQSRMDILNFVLMFFKERLEAKHTRRYYSVKTVANYVYEKSNGKHKRHSVKYLMEKCVPVVFYIINRKPVWAKGRVKLFKLTVVGQRIIEKGE